MLIPRRYNRQLFEYIRLPMGSQYPSNPLAIYTIGYILSL